LHFEATESTGASSNVFGNISQGIDGVIRPGDDYSSILWGTVNTPIYLNVDSRSNTYTKVSVRLVTRQE